MEVIHFSETLVTTCKTTQRYNPDDRSRHGNKPSCPIKSGEFIDQLSEYYLHRKDFLSFIVMKARPGSESLSWFVSVSVFMPSRLKIISFIKLNFLIQSTAPTKHRIHDVRLPFKMAPFGVVFKIYFGSLWSSIWWTCLSQWADHNGRVV
jgi:hypothetical protein